MNLGIPPSRLGWFARRRLTLITRPGWMEKHGESGLEWFLSAEKDLKKNGIVVPGTFIQANSNLFKPGAEDHPGELLFSLSGSIHLEFLRELASQIYLLKGEHSNDPEELFFSRYLADEMQRVQGVKVPQRLCPGSNVYVSTAIFYRAHLPKGILRGTVYPILVSPQSFVAMILPKQYWTAEGNMVYEEFI